MSTPTPKSIKLFLVKQLFLSIVSAVYFALVLWIPLDGRTGIQYIQGLFQGAIKLNNLTTLIHPIFLLIYLLMAVYSLRTPILFLCSKDRCQLEPNPSESLCGKLQGATSCSTLVVTVLGIIFALLSMNPTDLRGFATVFYSTGGVAYSILLLLVFNKDSVSKYLQNYNMKEYERLQAEANAKKKTQADAAEQEIEKLSDIAKYKELLNKGVISQEDFEEKKNEIMNR